MILCFVRKVAILRLKSVYFNTAVTGTIAAVGIYFFIILKLSLRNGCANIFNLVEILIPKLNNIPSAIMMMDRLCYF